MENISVLIIEGDLSERESLKRTLAAFKERVEILDVADMETGYLQIQKQRPQIVIYTMPIIAENSLRMIEKISKEFPETSVLVKSKDNRPETIIKTLRAGAKDFFLEQTSNGDMQAAIEKIIRQKEGEAGSGSQIITVFSGKGGVGTTMIATNLAINLVERTAKSAVLVDLNLQLGNINMYLDVRSFSTLSDVIANFDRLDHSLLNGSLAKHNSGVCVLSAPKELEDSELITAEQISKILTLLKESFDYVIIDTPHYFDEYNLPAFDLADTIMLVSCPLLPSIRNTQRCINTFKRLGYSADKVRLVINRYLKPSEVTLKEIEDTLEWPIFWMVPNDFETVTSSINRGEPISHVSPRAEINTSLTQLANKFAGPEASASKKRGWGLLNLLSKKEMI